MHITSLASHENRLIIKQKKIYNLMEQSPWEAKSQSVTKIPPFMDPEGSLLCSQEPATGPYPEPDEYSPELPTILP
jgi:hypothetical protein